MIGRQSSRTKGRFRLRGKRKKSTIKRTRLETAKVTWGMGPTLCVVAGGKLQMFAMTKAQHRALMASGFRL